MRLVKCPVRVIDTHDREERECGARVQATCEEETYFDVEANGELVEVDQGDATWRFYCDVDHDLDALVNISDYHRTG